MTIEELYEQIGGDYGEAKGRLFSESLVERFVVKFLDDTSCNDLFAAWEAGDEKAAFEAAHTAKGVCANLALTTLANLSSTICEALRPGNDALRSQTDVEALVRELKTAYQAAVERIKAYAEGVQ